jgi:dolichol kinase
MIQIIIRFLVGGIVVSGFALIGDLLKPKSFAGLFGAAPSVALATLALTVASEGAPYAAIEGRSMLAGAIAFFVYASLVSWVLMRYKSMALCVTICSIPVWFTAAFGLWYALLR